jgi:two-component system sensor histidine kinase/response regulator
MRTRGALMSEELTESLVFIVDDDATHLHLLQHILQDSGHQTRTFSDGPSALRELQNGVPDLILLDVEMPGMNGYEVCQRIKSNHATAQVPVIFISVLDDSNSKLKAFQYGAVDYIPKPFQLEEVTARAGTHLKLRAYQKQLETNLRKLRQTEELRDNLTSMLVHDLRSPLTGLAASLDLLGLHALANWNAKDRAITQLAKQTAVNLLDMVTSLLDISRFEAGMMPLNKTRADLRKIAEEAAASVHLLAGARSLKKDFPGTSHTMECDPDIVRRVITNLLANAYKFTPDGSEVTVRIKQAEGECRLEVVDEGPGIPEDYQKRIFEKFGQVQSRRNFQSTGLGLAFCKLAIEAHGGRIGVVSQPEQGSTFWFSLPARVDP